MRTTRLVLAALLCSMAGPAAAQDPGAPAPTVRVSVERIDPSSFPNVDVYFRVVDTVPNSRFHAIRPGDVRVAEAAGGTGAFQAVAVTGDNFAKPEIRPLAMSLAVDRSISVTKVLRKLRSAAVRFLQGMSDNGPLADDAVSLVFFSGFANLAQVLHLPLTTDKQVAMQVANDHLAQTAIGTPLHKAWNLAVRDAAENDYPAKGVLMLTDGKQFPPGQGPHPAGITQAAYSNGVPVFNFAFVQLDPGGGMARESVYRPWMVRMSSATDGAYFEPESPIPLLPPLPDAPKDKASAAGLDDAQAEAYLRRALALAVAQVGKDPDANLAVLSPVIAKLTGRDNITPSEIAALDPANEPAVKTAAGKLSYDALLAIDGGLSASIQQTVTEEDLEQFYVEQVANMFTKVRASLKTLYKVTFRSTAECRAELRDVLLDVAYQARRGAGQIALRGQGVGRYVTPLLAEEDVPGRMMTTLNPQSPVNDLLFGAGVAPRDGVWRGPTEIRYAVDLMGPGSDGRPVVLASRTAAGEVKLNEASDVVASLDGKERDELTAYLSAVDLKVTVDAASGSLAADLTGRTPTCLRDPEKPWSRPRENAEAKGFRKLLWYRIQTEAVRAYDYLVTIPTADGNPGVETAASSFVKTELPLLVAFVTDTTAPTIAVYLTPQSDSSSSRAESVELPADDPARTPAILLSGAGWSAGVDAQFSGSQARATTVFPLDVDGRQVEGFFVREDVRVQVRVLARDNFDRNSDHSYLTLAGGGVPSHSKYSDEDAGSAEAIAGEAPFLARVPKEEQGKRPGVTLSLEDDGSAVELEDSLLFRRQNYPVGPEIAIKVRATDAAGNTRELRIPVKVLGTDIEVRRLAYESRRAD